jgi:serine protease Do
MNSSSLSFRSKIAAALLAGAAFATTLGLTGNGFPAAAFAEAVRIEAPAQPGFADVVEKVSPAVVSVRVKGNLQPVADDGGEGGFGPGSQGFDQLPDNHPLKRFFKEFGGPNGDQGQRGMHPQRRERQQSQGSGFFISEDGYIVTNNHVVDDGAEFTVVMHDGTEMDAKLIGKDKKTDLAVLKVEPSRKFTYVAFAADHASRVGDWVVAVGNPFGLGGTVTAGIVSALGRDIGAGPYDDFMQIDAAVNRGNSGGPTFNLNGEVVGVNTAIFSPSGGNVGIAFAIPASTAKQVVGDLMKDGSIKRGWLGVQIQPVSTDIADSLGLKVAKGAMVNDVQDNSPAKKAGLEVGDVVMSVGGNAVEDPKDLARKVAAIQPGAATDVVVWRNGAEKTVSVTIEKLTETAAATPDKKLQDPAVPQDLTGFGLKVTPNENGAGVVVTDVDPDSAASDRGVAAGDVIAAVNDTDVASAGDITKAVEAAAAKGRKSVLLRIDGENGSRFVALPVAKG